MEVLISNMAVRSQSCVIPPGPAADEAETRARSPCAGRRHRGLAVVPANQACGGCQQFYLKPLTAFSLIPFIPTFLRSLHHSLFQITLLLISAPLLRSLILIPALRTRGYDTHATRCFAYGVGYPCFSSCTLFTNSAPVIESLTMNVDYEHTHLPSTSSSSSPPHTSSTAHAYTARSSCSS